MRAPRPRVTGALRTVDSTPEITRARRVEPRVQRVRCERSSLPSCRLQLALQLPEAALAQSPRRAGKVPEDSLEGRPRLPNQWRARFFQHPGRQVYAA